MTELGACQPVQAHTGFRCLYCQLPMHVRRNADHELTAKMFGCDGIRNRFFVLNHVGHNLAHKPMARVDRLHSDLKQVLRTASVIGRSFLYRILRAVEEADRKLEGHIGELLSLELIREKHRIPELEYIFKHALAQEATYESILLQKRRELHNRVGQAIETLFADRIEEFYSLLAYHYARGEAWQKAHAFLLKTGDQAGRVAADTEALAHYRQALEAYTRAFGDKWEPLQRATLERKMGEAFFRRGEHALATEYLHRALANLGKRVPMSRWRLGLAIWGEIMQQIIHRLFPSFFLHPVKRQVDPTTEEEILIYQFIGWIEAFGDYKRFLMVSLRGLNLSQRAGFAYGVSVASMAIGTTCNLIPAFKIAKNYHEKAVRIAEEIKNPTSLGLAYLGLTHYYMCTAAWDVALEHGQKGAKVYQETGDIHGWGYVTYMMAVAMAYKGDFSKAINYCSEIVRLGQEGADSQVRCWGLWTQGFILMKVGNLDEAVHALRTSRQLAQQSRDDVFNIATGHELGRCHIRQAQLEKALHLLEEVKEFYDEHRTKAMVWLPFRSGLAEAYMMGGGQRNNHEKKIWLEKAGRACQNALKHGKAYRSLLPEAMRLKGTYEWLSGRIDSAAKWWQRSLELAEKMGQRYDAGLSHLEIGKRLGDRTHLSSAEAILTEAGVKWDI